MPRFAVRATGREDNDILRVDLHTHSTASDGALAPLVLCERARQRGVELLAITDHDTCAGYRAAAAGIAATDLRLIPAAELSCQWRNTSVHVVGLNLDPDHPIAQEALSVLQQARVRRAEVIGERLAKLGMPGTHAGAVALAGDSQVGRPHFARYLLERGFVTSENQAFERYLGSGKPGDVKALWPGMAQVVEWIRAAGGTAVLAHPLKYRLTNTRLKVLLGEFTAAGGGGLEVVAGRQLSDATTHLSRLCHQFKLLASVGSDFHQPGQFWADVGDVSPLPSDCEPIWAQWLD